MPKGGHMPGKPDAVGLTVEIDAGQATYTATRLGKLGGYVLTHRCWSGDEVVVNEYHSVPWYTKDDTVAVLGPFATAGDRCKSFVWIYPDSTVPVSNTVEVAL